MANPLRDFFMGTVAPAKKDLADALTPRRSFADVILPATTHKQLEFALVQIKKSDLIFEKWGLGERHNSGMGLAFNFAGPPGTGKTICAEAVAFELGKRLFIVRYAEMESLWAGETGKNVTAIFRAAAEADAVLFFDEADAIATRRFGQVTQGYQRESNAVVNVLLKELEEFPGVVIFATNLASNFDPAFERRIRTHILFEMPDAPARERIWKVQIHAGKTPLADDVDFKFLAEKYPVPGGDIKNAVLKAAQMASAEPGPDAAKQIHQRHFIAGIEEVANSKKVMEQSIFNGDGSARAQFDPQLMAGMQGAFEQLAQNDQAMGEDLGSVIERANLMEAQLHAIPEILQSFDQKSDAARLALQTDIGERIEKIGGHFTTIQADLARFDERAIGLAAQVKTAMILGGLGILVGIGGIITAILR
ncbi:ATPase family associated with various cellular activities (AAA) [Abditibacterium utsteinense]|uniref:ATPase family associated with various cellular activities (AAA) n=1 Tax=Abditibacterium utsteinense TaxID=1960156 RepID=A0A2S8SST1_9BACT|nr:ATP-binding protein [Abditibacterium utsteinense]PQV63874.1 ATPase family associated with various cellular activities (AAA) [Abditibacterium utsteinense]